MAHEWMGNALWRYLAFLAAFLCLLGIFFLAHKAVISRLRVLARRTATDLDDLLVDLLERVRMPEGALVAFWLSTRHLRLPAKLDHFFQAVLLVVLTYRAVTMLLVAADYAVRRMLASPGRGAEADRGAAGRISYLISGLLWVLAALFVLSNLGFNVSSMLAGLGIGGVAAALAAQAVLGDLFSALAIYLDRPFVVGDFIVSGDMQGTVEHIGIKTTRVRALSGEMVIIANSKLTSSQIQNFRLLRERRVAFSVKVPFQTPPDKVRRVPELVRAAVSGAAGARFDRAHLKAFGDCGFEFEAVYFVADPGYGLYMDVNQAVHLGILEAFRKEGIALALPARTIIQQASQAAPVA